MALERPQHRAATGRILWRNGRSVIDAVDQRRQFLAPDSVEQIRLMPTGGHEIEQHDADGERLIARDPRPKLIESAEQKAGVARLVEADLIPPAPEIADP
jgi:hypothetical protein